VKRRLKEQFSHYKKPITNNENSSNNKQGFIIEIDDDNEYDLEMLYSRYSSSEYEIFFFLIKL
jgi:hypothetical protein